MGYKEILKVIVGAAVWDFLIAMWCIVTGYYPIGIFWINMGLMGLMITAGVDLAIIIVFSIIAWAKKKPEEAQATPSTAPATPATPAPKEPSAPASPPAAPQKAAAAPAPAK